MMMKKGMKMMTNREMKVVLRMTQVKKIAVTMKIWRRVRALVRETIIIIKTLIIRVICILGVQAIVIIIVLLDKIPNRDQAIRKRMNFGNTDTSR
jgi:hypothetical protein